MNLTENLQQLKTELKGKQPEEVKTKINQLWLDLAESGIVELTRA